MTDVITVPVVPRVHVHGGGEFPVHRIYCVGRNYAEHAAEMGHDARESPFFFMKPADAVLPVREGETGRDGLPDAHRATCTTRSSWWWRSATPPPATAATWPRKTPRA